MTLTVEKVPERKKNCFTKLLNLGYYWDNDATKSRQTPQEAKTIKIKKIIRSKRKSIAMYINDDAALIVRAPFNISEKMLNKVVLKHTDRLQKIQKEVQIRNLKFNKKEFINGEKFLYLGNYYHLKLVDNQDCLLY